MKEQVQVLKVVLNFLEKLSEEQIELLVSKKAKLTIDYKKNVVTHASKACVENAPSNKVCIEEVSNKLEGFTTREEGLEYIKSLTLLKSDLSKIAKKCNISLGSKDTKAVIIDKIIENIVGSKIKFDALYNTDLKR